MRITRHSSTPFPRRELEYQRGPTWITQRPKVAEPNGTPDVAPVLYPIAPGLPVTSYMRYRELKSSRIIEDADPEAVIVRPSRNCFTDPHRNTGLQSSTTLGFQGIIYPQKANPAYFIS